MQSYSKAGGSTSTDSHPRTQQHQSKRESTISLSPITARGCVSSPYKCCKQKREFHKADVLDDSMDDNSQPEDLGTFDSSTRSFIHFPPFEAAYRTGSTQCLLSTHRKDKWGGELAWTVEHGSASESPTSQSGEHTPRYAFSETSSFVEMEQKNDTKVTVVPAKKGWLSGMGSLVSMGWKAFLNP